MTAIIRVNITDTDGVLLGSFSLDKDDLYSPFWIGKQVLDTLPRHLRPGMDISEKDFGEREGDQA